MKLAANIAPHLPFLRRFSRALTGSQTGGDAYVVALLEALIADPGKFVSGPGLRIALYRAYCQLWESVSLNLKAPSDSSEWEENARQQLSSIAPKSREAFLLMAVEGFNRAEVGIILDKNPDEIQALLDDASHAIIKQVVTDVMIIEDEPIIAMDLEALLRQPWPPGDWRCPHRKGSPASCVKQETGTGPGRHSTC